MVVNLFPEVFAGVKGESILEDLKNINTSDLDDLNIIECSNEGKVVTGEKSFYEKRLEEARKKLIEFGIDPYAPLVEQHKVV